MFEQMSVKGNWSLASPTCHIPDRWINEKGELSCRKRKQALPALFFVRNSCASGYQTTCTQSRKDHGDILRNWSSVLHLAHKVSDFSENVMKEFHVGPDKGHIERSCRDIDVITFGNLCVDIVLNVPTLPPKSYKEKLAYMNDLARSSPEKKFWEAGGNSNFAIAAARLGMRCAALGHIGDEKYGKFLHEVLEKEGVQVVGLDEKNIKDETLVCWVLIDSEHRHGFCSRFDFNKDPAFKWMNELPKSAKDVIQRSKVVFFNGFVFDEITPDMIISAVEFANKTGCVVFFDPGPRAKSLFNGSACQKHALQKLLMYSDVLLLTAEEAKALTALEDPILSAQSLLAESQRTKWVIVKMGDKGCLMATSHGVYQFPAFKVDVKDTVGCGDSFAAAIALGYTQKLPVTSMLALANAVGAATAMGCGAGRNVATVNDVANILLSSNVCVNPELVEIQKLSPVHLKEIGREEAAISDLNMLVHSITRETASLLMDLAPNSGHT